MADAPAEDRDEYDYDGWDHVGFAAAAGAAAAGAAAAGAAAAGAGAALPPAGAAGKGPQRRSKVECSPCEEMSARAARLRIRSGLRLFEPRYGQTCVRCIVHGYTELAPCACYATRSPARATTCQPHAEGAAGSFGRRGWGAAKCACVEGVSCVPCSGS